MVDWRGVGESRLNNLQHLLASTTKIKCFGHTVCTLLCSRINIALISDFHCLDLQACIPQWTVSRFQMFIASLEKPFSCNLGKVHPFVRSAVSTVFKFPEFINDLTLFM